MHGGSLLIHGGRDNNAALAAAGRVNLLPFGGPDTQNFVSGCRSTIDVPFSDSGRTSRVK